MNRITAIIFFTIFFFANCMAQLNTDRLMSVGRNALYFEDYVLSIQYFNQVIRVKPQLVEPFFYRAIAKIQLEDYVGAEEDLNIVIDKNPFIPMAYYARGFALSHQERWSEASSDFSMAMQYSPDNMLYALNRVEAFRMSGRYPDALTDLDLLIAARPNHPDLYFERGIIQLESGDTVAALSTFNHLTVIDSLNSDAWSAYATVAMMTADDSLALKSFDKSVRLGANNPSTFINRGILNYRHHNYTRAMQDYNKAVQLDSMSVSTLFNRALLRVEIGDYNNAVADLDRILEIDPNSYEAIYQRAIVNTTIGEDERAITDYTRILKRYPTFVPALYARAEIYDRLGRDKEAFIDRDKAYSLSEEYRRNGSVKQDSISVGVQVSGVANSSSISDIVSLFNTSPDNSGNNRYADTRGSVQNMSVQLRQSDNITLSYYKPSTEGLPIALYNPPALQELNSSGKFSAPLYLVSDDIKLTTQMVNYHFEMINQLSESIAANPNGWMLHMARAIHHATIQDFDNAISDLSNAILLQPDNALVFFFRANIRQKQLEVMQDDVMGERNIVSGNKHTAGEPSRINGIDIQDKARSKQYELIMHDYDYTISVAPDFAFSWYNKANLLVLQQDYRAAIVNFTKAIELEPRLAEAYFNRGLTHIFLNDMDSAIRDLSKAGELGLYRAYGILKKIQNK